MAGFNGMFIARVEAFSMKGYEMDANGHQNVIFDVLAGKAPSKRIVSGSIALNKGFIIGDTVVVSFTEKDEDPEYGRQFAFGNGGRLTTLEWLSLKKEFGDPEIVNVETKGKKETVGDTAVAAEVLEDKLVS